MKFFRFLVNTMAYGLYCCFVIVTVYFVIDNDVSVTYVVNHFMSVSWLDKISLLFKYIFCAFLLLTFVAAHLFLWRFDRMFSTFIRSRRLYKDLMIKHDSMIRKVSFYSIPFVRLGSMKNPIFRAMMYIVSVFSYKRYRYFLISNPEDPLLAKEKYMNSKKARVIERDQPIIHFLIFQEDFSDHLSWPYLLVANMTVYMAIAFLLTLIPWLIMHLIHYDAEW